ncbi:acyl CoA:acetate/3-ketoacid CoA transferase [Planosporangium thailandense]|uniref:Acyl CoA:acetate/3-ketoacid CoA transferase n=1 Tax=Planosporangium thailandense TaxID=765197 RepID=A0ABX0Y5M2_9ACTN|nr:CoA-transferase [Planosporangium thailandense]NJC73432.1 acyl CoA:acetate/3-ketoacid CoA transferase [Planosporangium thailandense]
MTHADIVDADRAAALIPDGAVVALTGNGGGVLEADEIYAAIERRFLREGHPHGLTLIHALGIGDGEQRGLNRFAYEGLVRRVIGGHWSWSPRMQQLAREGKIEAYALPAGVISALLRESGSNRPGLITRVGLGTFVDPRQQGGRLNDAARDELVSVVEIDGVEYLRYHPLNVDVAIVRGSAADSRGNVSLEDEPALLDSLAAATAAKGRGGKVLCQVKRLSRPGHLDPRLVHLPAPVVDALVVAPAQWQTYASEYDPALSGRHVPTTHATVDGAALMPDVRTIIARRAALEVVAGSTVNVGFGISAQVVDVLEAAGRLEEIDLLIEQGAVGGAPVGGALFGVSKAPFALLPSTNQFDLFAARILDLCVLGMAEVDPVGNVNVSYVGENAVGPGGFIDIAQGATKAVFCGTFTARGLKVAVRDGGLDIVQEGAVPKFVERVRHITYSAQLAREERRSAIYVTERAVFELRPEGLALIEVAPGIDIERDVLSHMDFAPIVDDVRTMPADVFRSGPLNGVAPQLAANASTTAL